MANPAKIKNLLPLDKMLPIAERGQFAVGAYSARSTTMVEPVLRAGQKNHSPLIVQISQKEFARYGLSAREFADEFYRKLFELSISVPVGLHLDHTTDLTIIWEAIAAGFTSVMIDASAKPLEENIAISKEVVDYAHARGVAVEAELGRIGTTDFVETEEDEEFYTQPEEALRFVQKTKVDALAVSVGTAHGVYTVRKPKIDYERLKAIRALTPVSLVIHGGSGIPEGMLHQAYQLVGGGVSKVNIATDLELAYRQALGIDHHLTNAELAGLSAVEKAKAQQAVENLVSDKICHFVLSAGHDVDFKKVKHAG